jgi:hypothetical protein
MNFKTPKLADSQLELKLLDAPAQGSWHIYKDPSGALPLVCN